MVDQKLAQESALEASPLSAYEFSKRLADILFSATLLLFFSPVLLVVAVWVRLDSPGPIFFRQIRVGQGGRIFKIIKFRTMVQNAESMGPQVTSRNDSRMTKCGSLLRAWKLDELPQFLNVLLGDMSIVGPRPQVCKYVDLFPASQKGKILSVKPGITGPTAIKFRHEEEMLQGRENREQFYIDVLLPIKCDLDEEYINERSLWLDLKVTLQTGAMLVHGIMNRLRRIPIGNKIEHPIPDSALSSSDIAFAAVDVSGNERSRRGDENDDSVQAGVR